MQATYPMAYVTAPGKVEFREHRLPKMQVHQVLVKVRAASICGSDLHIFKGRHPAAPLPVAVGHELSGEIVQVGSEVTLLKEGDRVAVEPVIACGNCHFCQRGEYHLCLNISFQYRQGQGAFAPYFVADERWVHTLPANVSFAEGALLEPLSVAVHAVRKSGLQFGQTSAVFGAGAIGLLLLMVIKQAGGGDCFVVDLQPHRLEAARQLSGIALNAREVDVLMYINEATSSLGVERSYEAVGIEATLVQALQVLKKGGIATLVGIFEEPQVSIPANLFVQREITLSGSQGYCWDFQRALELVGDGRVQLGALITHRLPLPALQQAFDLLSEPGNKGIKVVVTIDG
ncbi:MAG TPA: alcohol dehydrogenase catalytic domain-containing protein [Anaerolineales bacterium]|nr:alcohol dehydrogenase catalytic domain-containing protein [Anaerolineales bacterium]